MFGAGGARRRGVERAGFSLYGQAVASARQAFFYGDLAVADTLDGRFDMICLHVALLVRRLWRFDRALAQSVFDAMFTDMDDCLREAGVGDLGVPRRVRAMWEAFNGRSRAYREALDRGDSVLLSQALERNIWRGQAGVRHQAVLRARWALRQDACLAAQDDAALASGSVRFSMEQA